MHLDTDVAKPGMNQGEAMLQIRKETDEEFHIGSTRESHTGVSQVILKAHFPWNFQQVSPPHSTMPARYSTNTRKSRQFKISPMHHESYKVLQEKEKKKFYI